MDGDGDAQSRLYQYVLLGSGTTQDQLETCRNVSKVNRSNCVKTWVQLCTICGERERHMSLRYLHCKHTRCESGGDPCAVFWKEERCEATGEWKLYREKNAMHNFVDMDEHGVETTPSKPRGLPLSAKIRVLEMLESKMKPQQIFAALIDTFPGITQKQVSNFIRNHRRNHGSGQNLLSSIGEYIHQRMYQVDIAEGTPYFFGMDLAGGVPVPM